MAIRLIKKGEIECDACHKQFGTILTSNQVFFVIESEQRFTQVRCMGCSEKPINLEQVENL